MVIPSGELRGETGQLDSRSARTGSSRRRQLILVASGCALLLLLASFGFGVALWTRIGRVDVDLPGSAPGGTTYLFIGSDSRAGIRGAADRRHFGDAPRAPGEHADIVLLLRVPDHGNARLLSVPRDLLVLSRKHALVRLGPTLNRGAQPVVDELCRSLGIGVDHLEIIRFLELKRIVDAVGGVDITVDQPTRDSFLNTFYIAGTHHLDGNATLSYVRSRHGEVLRSGQWQPEAEAALQRGTRARAVLAQVAKRAPSVADPFDFAGFAWTASGAITIDSSAGVDDLRHLVSALRSLPAATPEELPVTIQPGPVPVAQLRHEAAMTLERFRQGRVTGPCSHPQVPYSDGTVGTLSSIRTKHH